MTGSAKIEFIVCAKDNLNKCCSFTTTAADLSANNKIGTFSNQQLGECLNKDYEEFGGIGAVKVKSWFGWVGEYINVELFDETTVHCPIHKQVNDQSLQDTFSCAPCSSYSK